MLQHAAVDCPVIILNASETGCAALILTLTGVQHVPFPNLDFTEVNTLVKLIRHAITQDGGDSSLHRSSHIAVEGLIEQTPLHSEIMQQLRLPLERHIGRASDTSRRPDDIFRFVLGALWESVVNPVIRTLDLKVNWFYHKNFHLSWTHYNLQKSDKPSNLQWCPTGPFAFLPIHAAGIYLDERTESISDYVISSYTPTISSLLTDIPLSTN